MDVFLRVRSENGNTVYEQQFQKVRLPAGRTVTQVADVKLPVLQDGLYMLRYTVYEEAHKDA